MRYGKKCFNEELIPAMYGNYFKEDFKDLIDYSTEELIKIIYEKFKYLKVRSKKLYLIRGECKEYTLLNSLKSSHLNQIITDRFKSIEIPQRLRNLFDIRIWSKDDNFSSALLSYLSDIDEDGDLIFNLKDYGEILKYPRPILLDATHIFWDPRINIDRLLNNSNLLINLSPWLLLYPKFYLLIISKADSDKFDINYLEKFRIENAGKMPLTLIAYRLIELFKKEWKAQYMKALSYASYLLMKLKDKEYIKVCTNLDELRHANVVVIEMRHKIPERYCLEN
jgi:hypothetical protein